MRPIHLKSALLATLLLLTPPPLGAAGKKGGDTASDKAVAEMGEVRLSADHFRTLFKTLDREDRQRLKDNPQALRKVVAEELVRQYLVRQAKQEGWERKAEVKVQINRAIDEILFTQYLLSKVAPDASYPSEQVVQEVYDKNKARLIRPDRVHLAQIFLATAVEETPRTDLEQRLSDLRSRLGNEEFAEVAKQLSDHKESAAKGGDLGWQEMGGLGPELRPVIAGLKTGELSQPLKSERGWHIFKLVERESGKPMTLEEARPAILNSLRNNMAKNKEGLFLEETVNRNPPKIKDEALPDLVRP